MKRIAITTTVAVIALLNVGAALAQTEKPIQLSLFDPVQIVKNDQSIKGVRLNLLYGRNADVTGGDLGLVNRVDGDFVGVQWGAVNINEGNSSGWSNAVVNWTEGESVGLQTAYLFNSAQALHGVQATWAVNNVYGEMRGLQISLLNMTDTAYGLQIGLINIIREGARFKFFPIVNWDFDE